MLGIDFCKYNLPQWWFRDQHSQNAVLCVDESLQGSQCPSYDSLFLLSEIKAMKSPYVSKSSR